MKCQFHSIEMTGLYCPECAQGQLVAQQQAAFQYPSGWNQSAVAMQGASTDNRAAGAPVRDCACALVDCEHAKPKLTTEQIHAELKRESANLPFLHPGVKRLIDQLPDPPKFDVADEIGRVCSGYGAEWRGLTANAKSSYVTRAALIVRRYLELRGLPADPELEGR